MAIDITRIMMNSYVEKNYSHGFDLGFVKSENADSIIEQLKEKFKDEKSIYSYVFEKEKEKPVSIKRMALKIVAEIEEGTVDYLDNSIPEGTIYEVTLKRYDKGGSFDHILHFGTMFVSKEEECSEEEMENKLLVNLKMDLNNAKLKVKKVKIKTFDKLAEKVNDIIF